MKRHNEISRHPFSAAYALQTQEGWDLIGVTYQNLPCGCHVSGGGVLPSPLTVTHCDLHAAVIPLLKKGLPS